MSAWECPRCGTMNAIWVERCVCGPKVYTSNTTSLLPQQMGGVAHGDPRRPNECGRPVRYVQHEAGSSQAGHYECPVHGRIQGSAWSYTEASLV